MGSKNLEGISGWLLLYVIISAIVVISSIITGLVTIVHSLLIAFLGFETNILTLLLGENLYSSSYIVYFLGFFYSIVPLIFGAMGIYSWFLIIKKRKKAVRLTMTWLWFNLIIGIISTITLVFSGVVSEDLLLFVFAGIMFLLVGVAFPIVYIQYFKKSERVRNTLKK